MRRAWAWLAWIWLALVLALAVQQIGFWRAPQLDSDVMALLPSETQDPLITRANRQIVEGATRQVVVLIGSNDWSQTRTAAEAFAMSLAGSAVLESRAGQDNGSTAALDFYCPYRDRLLTPGQRARLQEADVSALSAIALSGLYGPGVGGGLSEWRADPVGLWPEWWQARMGQDISVREGFPSISRDGLEWAILHFDATTPAFRLDGNAQLKDALDQAERKALAKVPRARVLRAGVPLHAEAAAVRASWETNTIGWGSLLAVIGLLWLAFRSLRPVVLVALSLLIGLAAAVAVTVLVFGKIHLLTLVFGASLVGVAEDYGIHYFACRQGRNDLSAHGLMRFLMPGLVLALVTSVLAYMALGLAPFPGLRQMAVFSATGLLAAFATVACWFPWLDKQAHGISRFGQFVSGSLAAWPRFRHASIGGWVALILLGAFAVTGLQRLQVRDDLRSLQNSPEQLLADQRDIGQLLGMPSPAQYYLVSGPSAEAVLQREEALKARLDGLVARQQLSGYSAVSDWVPSLARQRADASLSASVEVAVLSQASTVVGEPLSRPEFAASALRLEDWLQQPVSEPLRSRWLGQVDGRWASVLMLNGVGPASDLKLLKQQAAGVDGARWVDRTSEISRLLAYYRSMMAELLLAGFVAVGFALWWRYRALAWRALLPTILATALSLAALGWLGEPFQLFTVLALLLLLGIGVDYGIFLLEHQGDGASWLAVSMGAGSTLLAFGLLSLSATPALHSFGLTMLFGISLVWLLSPWFRPDADTSINTSDSLSHRAQPTPGSARLYQQELY
jgi:predicted exporter